jgi:hypothetical protein
MKKLGKFKLFGLLIFLSVALVFVGVNFLEGKKGKMPPVEWWATIPTYEIADEEGYNLYGIGIEGDGYYEDDSTHVFVSGGSGLRKHPDYPYHVFIFMLNNNKSWGDSCPEDGEYYIPGDYTVGFQNISIDPLSVVVYPNEGSTCRFPPLTTPEPACWGGEDPSCMECFLNNWEHPSSWECVDGENRGYMGAYFKIKVFDEIWNYPMGVPIEAEMSLYISVYTGRWTPWGEDFYHDIEIHIPRGNNYMAEVTRLDKGWKIVSIPPSLTGLVEFRETYKELLGELKPKGKSGNYHNEYEKHTTMTATADHFSFDISWISY